MIGSDCYLTAQSFPRHYYTKSPTQNFVIFCTVLDKIFLIAVV